MPGGAGVDLERITWVLNPFDEIASEQAVQFKEKFGGEVVVISAGPARANDALRQVLAQGADRGIRIDFPEMFFDHGRTARAIADVCEREKFDVIFAGKKATDDDLGIVQTLVASLMHIPCVSPVREISLDSSLNKLTATLELDGNVRQNVECDLPCMISCEKGLCVPRYPSLPNVMRAKSKPIEEIQVPELFDSKRSMIEMCSLKEQSQARSCKMIEGSPKEAAVRLVKLLHDIDRH